jgi:hypothetical protein
MAERATLLQAVIIQPEELVIDGWIAFVVPRLLREPRVHLPAAVRWSRASLCTVELNLQACLSHAYKMTMRCVSCESSMLRLLWIPRQPSQHACRLCLFPAGNNCPFDLSLGCGPLVIARSCY